MPIKDNESPRVTVRIPQALLRSAKARARAGGVQLGEHIRRLLAADAGEPVPEMPRGIKTVGARRRKQLARAAGLAGAKARWGAPDEG